MSADPHRPVTKRKSQEATANFAGKPDRVTLSIFVVRQGRLSPSREQCGSRLLQAGVVVEPSVTMGPGYQNAKWRPARPWRPAIGDGVSIHETPVFNRPASKM